MKLLAVSLFVAGALSSLAISARAQDVLPHRPHCSDTLTPVGNLRVVFEVYAREHRIWRNTEAADLSSDYLAGVAEGIAAHLRMPSVVDSRVFHASDTGALHGTRRAAEAAAIFKPRLDGRIKSVHLYGVGTGVAMQQALVQAIIQADSAGGLPALPPGRYPNDLAVEVHISSRAQSEHASDGLPRNPHPAGAGVLVAVGFSHVGLYALDQAVEPIGRTQQVPYPTSALGAEVSDSLTMEYIVGDDGKIEVEGATLLSANYTDFVKAVARWMPRMRFKPAMIGSCRVRSLVRQDFKFYIKP